MAFPLSNEAAEAAIQQNQQPAPALTIPTPVPIQPDTSTVTSAPPDPTQEDAAYSPASTLVAQPRPGFVDRFKASADAMPVTGAPGGWARSLVASAVDAIGNISTNLGDAANIQVKNGGGWLEGVTQTLANREARLRQAQEYKDRQAQQALENKRADASLSMEQQRTDANIKEGHMHELQMSMAMRDQESEAKQKIQQTSAMLAEPFLSAGAPNLGSNLTSDDLTAKLKASNVDTSKMHVYQDGFAGVVNSTTGEPVLDSNGEQVIRPTYNLIGPVPQITPDKKQADFISKYTGQKFAAGVPMDGTTYYLLSKRAQTQQVSEMSVSELQDKIDESLSATERNKAETREKNLSNDQKVQNNRAATIFAPWLAGASGDPITALDAMSRDPKGRANVGIVESLYGPGNISRARQNELSDLQKTVQQNSKTIAEHSVPGTSPLDPDELADMESENRAARARINVLLQLSPSDPQVFSTAVIALNKIPPAQRQAYILGSTTASPAAKNYLLKYFGYPQLPAQPPVAPQAR